MFKYMGDMRIKQQQNTMSAIFTKLKMTSEEALNYLDELQNEIRVYYPDLTVNIIVRIPIAPYEIQLGVFTGPQYKCLFRSSGESFQNRIYDLKKFVEKNKDLLNQYKRK